jgi:hypothetical protein
MDRIRVGATVLGLALLAGAGVAQAQEVTGRVTGRVTDKDTGMPMGGVTVIMQGPQGEDATLTDDKGDYRFSSLAVGTYVIRFYAANTSAEAEQPGVNVAADKMVRVNAKIAGAAQAAAQQTYVITGKAPVIDIGSARVGAQFDQQFMQNVPLGRTYGDVIERAPGVFFDPSGNVSIGGATGLENIYLVNGLNVTGVQYGNLEAGIPTVGGGTNLPIEFLQQLDVNSGGYQAEFGGAMGGVINSVLKSGSNEFHGSAFLYDSPYWLAANPNPVVIVGKTLGYERKPDFDTSIGVEVGGPIIKDKLFFWAGFAPRITDSHVFRLTYAQQQDAAQDGMALLDANGNPVMKQLSNWTARIPETHRTYYYAGTLDFVPQPEHHLTLTLMGSPNFNDQLGNRVNGVSFASDPRWAQEELTKVNTDVNAHWTSKLFDHHWQIDAITGYHSEYFYDRSPYSDLNNQNQLEYWGANLWDLEHAPGCEPTTNANGTVFQPCPVDNYHSGGFGLEKKYTAGRYTAEIKFANLFEAGGHHEVKYGWHLEAASLDEDTWYSGPPGARGLVQLYPGASPNFNTFTFATLPPGAFPSSYGGAPGVGVQPVTNLLYPSYGYDDSVHAAVRSLSNAFFVQDSYSPPGLRNLTINAGVRYELQKMYDFQDTSFLSVQNLGPRVSAVYDPFNDGKSKISVGYGRYFEAIPLDIAARYFGGQGIVVNSGVPLSGCNQSNPYAWEGNGEWRNCGIPPAVPPGSPAAATYMNNAGGGTSLQNNGVDYPVQANLQGQYSNEVVASLERQVAEDTTVRLDYQHRWLGAVIEDGTADPSFTFVLANPGHVPESAITQAKANVYDAQQAANQHPADPQIAANLANANAILTTLQGLANAPSPERTYDAITLSLNRRFSKNWYARASYTYSRLIGNYEGLYQVEQNYFAPNGSNYTDTPDLYINQNGPLPNDHPHILHLDGYYTVPVGAKGRLTLGLAFTARSGMPRNYISDLYSGQQLNMLLPRGSAGRTPTVTELDGKIGYGRPLTEKVHLEGFLDFFNILNQQAATLTDDNYTYDQAAPIVNGTTQDLKFAKNTAGQPLTKNPNFGNALAYQTPFNMRLGLRLTF